MRKIQDALYRTKAAIGYDAFSFARKLNQTTGEKNDYYITLDQLDRILKNACPDDCHQIEPYGFVPEDGCPVHDDFKYPECYHAECHNKVTNPATVYCPKHFLEWLEVSRKKPYVLHCNDCIKKVKRGYPTPKEITMCKDSDCNCHSLV